MSPQNLPTTPVEGMIRLGQFLKLAGLVENGSEARLLIQEGEVSVNDEVDTRRGRQLQVGDRVTISLPTETLGAIVGN